MYGPSTVFGDRLHRQKYRLENETFEESITRMARALSDNETHRLALEEILGGMRFLPGGRVQVAAGSGREVTAFNCFVSGTIEDSFVDGPGSIMERAKEAATTMRMGGGIGYDFSTLRPKGAPIKRLGNGAVSTGPIKFMHIFNGLGDCTASVGDRRGAQMGILRVDHPDILDFINAKQDQRTLDRFNISVAVTDEFMEALKGNRPFPLRFNGEVKEFVSAAHLWDRLMHATWDWAEPGVFFVDTVNRMNNLWYCEEIAATNPCGEQPLPPYGACLLGSFNLTKYLHRIGTRYTFAWDRFHGDIAHVVRMMDNVIDATNYPLPQQKEEALNKRRMGLGVTGVANALEAIGLPYGSQGFLQMLGQVLASLTRESYKASALLAAEKGEFPSYVAGLYLAGPFVKQLPSEVQDLIQEHGVRNSHLTSIAPTGTISLAADNISSGIEPVFSYAVEREVHMLEGKETVQVEDYGVKVLGTQGRLADEITVLEHLQVLALAQKHVDSAVSKTCNVGAHVDFQAFKDVYRSGWRMGCKGLTTFRAAGKRFGMMRAVEPGATCTIDPITGQKECS